MSNCRSLRRLALPAFAAFAISCPSMQQGSAQEVSLAGSWAGGGVFIHPSGSSEKARCRATFRANSKTSYSMSGVCATASARVAQTAQLHKTGANTYTGRFFNAEYNVTGTIQVSVRGNHLAAQLNGGGASASLSLSR